VSRGPGCEFLLEHLCNDPGNFLCFVCVKIRLLEYHDSFVPFRFKFLKASSSLERQCLKVELQLISKEMGIEMVIGMEIRIR